uniref:7TM_GPCR_Srx domain-containing protein n=1 Tax=Globodera pallida TaxID=36090 RepID=A0A183BJW4_GLOPA
MIAAAIFNKTAHCRSLCDFLFFKGLNYFLLEPSQVPFFDLLILVTNYTFFSILVYIISDVYCLLFPESKEINTSTIWLVGAFILQIHILTKISVQKPSFSS